MCRPLGVLHSNRSAVLFNHGLRAFPANGLLQAAIGPTKKFFESPVGPSFAAGKRPDHEPNWRSRSRKPSSFCLVKNAAVQSHFRARMHLLGTCCGTAFRNDHGYSFKTSFRFLETKSHGSSVAIAQKSETTAALIC